MKIYLVGGAVRDELLGLPIKERDWVVVGATVNDMIAAGFRQVGKDFPVFLHPKTHEEYALARIERKIGRGYTGFEFDTANTVTLEEDLKRRDITINAMAKNDAGDIIDPYHGKDDLAKQVLRHVSPAFAEDPVRILRLARFAARFGFSVAPETLILMQQMVKQGEVDALVAERVWKEFERALLERFPEKFFEILDVSHALPILFPTVQSAHIQALARAAALSSLGQVRFAALMGNDSPAAIRALTTRYRIPNDYRDLALLVANYLTEYQSAKNLSPDALLNLLLNVDAFRREQRFYTFLTACQTLSDNQVTAWLTDAFHAAKSIDTQSALQESNGAAIAIKMKQLRLSAIEHWLQTHPKT